LEVKFIVSLLIDGFLKRLNPAIELKHLDIREFITKTMKKTPRPARNEAPIYIERSRKQTAKTTGYFAI